MSPREWAILAGWVVLMVALLRRAVRNIDRDEAELERQEQAKTQMQNWPES